MKIVISVLILCLTISICHAQKEGQALIDSLMADLPMMKEDTNKVKTLALLSFEFRNFELELGVTHGKEALKLSQELNYNFGIGISELSIAYNYFHINLRPEAIEHAHVAENVFLIRKDQDLLCATYLILSAAYGRANIQKGSDYLELARSIFDKGSILSWQLNNLSWLHNLSLSYECDSNDYYLMLYRELLGSLDNKYFRANYFKMLAEKHEEQNNLDSTIYYYRHTIPIYEELQIKRLLSWVYVNISKPKYWKIPDSGTSSLITEKEVESNLNKALSLALETGNILMIRDVYRLKYVLYLNQDKKDLALTTLQQVILYTDSLQKVENKKEISSLIWKFEMQLQEEEVELLELRNRQQLIGIVAGVIVVGILIVLVYMIIRNRRKIKKAYLRVHEQNEQLDKLLIQLKELDTMKSNFFANISHEFRTPLTLILGPIEKHLPAVKDSALKQDLNIVQRNALRLQRLINQILNLSKIESGKMKLQVREENIVSLVNGYIQSFESLAKQKNIDLIFHSAKKEIKPYIDKDIIEKILYNLLSNAFKFTDDGGRIKVEVTLSSPPLRDGSGGVKISISDTGRGISPEKMDHIFDRFYQVDNSYTREQEGTGIGLALTKELVKLHYGEIDVDSQEGKGSTFTVFLPSGREHFKPDEVAAEDKAENEIEDVPDQYPELATHAEKSNKDISASDESKSILLIVEDNADLLSYIRDYLDSSYFVIEARDGEEGLQEAIKNIPDLVLSDVMMPIMDGFELCQKLKTDERTSHIPVILLTARASSESKIEGLQTGADDYISKPFDPTELQIRIKNLILQRQKLREKFAGDFWKENKLPVLQSTPSGLSQTDKKFLQKALDIVNLHLSDSDFNVVRFGQEIAMSRQQLHRKFRALVNQSATEFIRTIRLKKAAELLTQRSDTVSEIAYDVGFNTLSYFTKSFQEQFGITPSEYLEKYSKNHK